MRISDWSSDVCSSDLCNQPRYRHAALYRLIHAPYSIKIVATGSLLAAARRRHLGGRFAEPRQRCERIMELKILDALLLQLDRKHTSELQSLMRISYAVFCLKKKIN